MLTDLDYDLLSAYIDGALTDSERADLESRLQTEPELRAELAELRATVTLLNNLPLRKAPRDFTLDARYARRTSFFASATFSALSTAAAIILFAVGTFLFTNNNAQQPMSAEQVQQVAIAMTATSATATTLDKGTAATNTDDAVANEVAPVTAPTIPEQEAQETITDGLIMQATATRETNTGSLFQPDTEQPADAGEDDTFSAAPASSSEAQGRSTEATETPVAQLFSAQPQPTGAMGGAAVGEPPTSDMGDTSASSMMMESTGTPVGTLGDVAPPPSSTLMPAAPLPAATFAPSRTQLPTATREPSATITPSPTLTLTHTPTSTPTLAPTAVPPVERERASTISLLPTLLLVLGAVFLVLAVATTIVRRRSRP